MLVHGQQLHERLAHVFFGLADREIVRLKVSVGVPLAGSPYLVFMKIYTTPLIALLMGDLARATSAKLNTETAGSGQSALSGCDTLMLTACIDQMSPQSPQVRLQR